MKKVLFLLLSASCAHAFATHITRSVLRCEFLDSNAVSKRYLLSMELTRDCSPNAIVFPYEMEAGVYKQSDSQLLSVYTLPLVYKQQLSACFGACRELAVYQQVLVLTNRPEGYRFCGLICCRSFSSNVLQDQDNKSFQGMMPYCSINGSGAAYMPQLLLPPDLYVAGGSADTIPYRFVLPEGADSVRISLSRPLTGGTLNNNFPTMPGSFPGFSYLQYSSAAYSALKPLGQNADIRVDEPNRRLLVQGNLNGNFTVGFHIKVYAGGRLNAEYRTEAMLYVSTSGTPPPSIDLSAASLSGARIRLDWTACFQGLKTWYVERSEGRPYLFRVLDSGGTVRQTYTDTGLVSNRMYDYRIAGISLAGDTVYSDTVQAVTWASGLTEPVLAGEKLKVYPVPVASACTVSVSGSGLLHLQLRDVSGRLVLQRSWTVAEAAATLDLSGLASGLYGMEVLGSDGKIYRSKLLRQ